MIYNHKHIAKSSYSNGSINRISLRQNTEWMAVTYSFAQCLTCVCLYSFTPSQISVPGIIREQKDVMAWLLAAFQVFVIPSTRSQQSKLSQWANSPQTLHENKMKTVTWAQVQAYYRHLPQLRTLHTFAVHVYEDKGWEQVKHNHGQPTKSRETSELNVCNADSLCRMTNGSVIAVISRLFWLAINVSRPEECT